MGSKQTKFEEINETAKIGTKQEDMCTLKINSDKELDPRSPGICRTPLVHREYAVEEMQGTNQSENMVGLLRKRILRGFVNNLSDPRSPTAHLNRTPLIFEEVDRTLDMNDTFADLFVETQGAPKKNIVEMLGKREENVEETKDIQMLEDEQQVTETITSRQVEHLFAESAITSFACVEDKSLFLGDDITMPSTAMLQPTPQTLLQQLDPRSPSIGVNRTPIIFNDDDETGEDALLEHILATLTLNMSANSSELSLGTTTGIKLGNKHLDRVRAGKKRLPQRKMARHPRQYIYEDAENGRPTGTPKNHASGQIAGKANEHKRTPLSCMRNRSRSVDFSA